jgi:Rrf2 family protein
MSRSAGYALAAVGYIAQNDKDGAVLSAKISDGYGIPLEYLLKILQQLVRANVLRSKRGPHGGFFLARRTDDITLLQIVEAVDGPLAANLNLVELTKNAPFSHKMEALCSKVTEDVRDVLGGALLSNFIGE